MENTIFVKFTREGIHCFPGAQNDVAFLRNPHRHLFHFRIDVEVFHDDREIEFIQFKRKAEGYYAAGILELNSKSCEMIARDLHAQIARDYPGRAMVIEVSEDGENGARLTFPASHTGGEQRNGEATQHLTALLSQPVSTAYLC